MRHRHVFAVLLMALFFSGVALTSVQGVENVTYDAGYVEWEMDMEQRLYVEGDDAETSVLQRERPDATLAFADVAPNTGLVPIFSLTSEPIVNTMVGTINMSAYFSAYLVPQAGFFQSTQCTSPANPLTPGDDFTTLVMTVSISAIKSMNRSLPIPSMPLHQTTLRTLPRNHDDGYRLSAGDTFSISLSAEHLCEGTLARIQWGGFETNAGASS